MPGAKRRLLINRATTRRYVLDYAKRLGRAGAITGVGVSVFDDLEAMARARLRSLVKTHPSGFKRLQA